MVVLCVGDKLDKGVYRERFMLYNKQSIFLSGIVYDV